MFGTDRPTANDSLRPVSSPLMRLLRRARFTTAFVGTIPWLAVITLTVFAALGSGASRADYIALFNGPHTATFAADGSGGLMFSTSGVSQDTVFYTILGGTDFATGGFKLAAVAFAASPLSSGAFRPIAATEGFTYAAPDGDALSGTVLWTSLAVGPEAAGRLSAQLSGELAVDTSVGDTDFLNDFSVGSTADIVAYFLPPAPSTRSPRVAVASPARPAASTAEPWSRRSPSPTCPSPAVSPPWARRSASFSALGQLGPRRPPIFRDPSRCDPVFPYRPNDSLSGDDNLIPV